MVARWNKRPVTRVDLANPIAVSSVLSLVFVGYLSFKITGSYKSRYRTQTGGTGIDFPSIRAAKVHMNCPRKRVPWHAQAIAF